MEKHLEVLSKSVRNKRVFGLRIGVAAATGVLIALVLGASSRNEIKAASSAFPIRGAGKAGVIAKFVDSVTIGSSVITEVLGNIGIGTSSPQAKLDVLGSVRIQGGGNGLIFPDNSVVHSRSELIGPQGPQGPLGPQGAQGTTGSTGPQGPVGPAGPAGTNGFSHIYYANGTVGLDHNNYATAATVSVPAGSYFVIGQAKLYNSDGDTQNFSCKLRDKDTDDDTEDFQEVDIDKYGTVTFTLQMLAQNVGAGTNITLACGSYLGQATGTVTVFPVNAIN